MCIRDRYSNDEKYARIHKRLTEKGVLTAKEMQLHRALMQVKNEVDNKLEGQEAVSYTHLDVYKRQVQIWLCS